ncbi:hypothetical protein [Streptomyces sp. PA5.6]|uniref:hypothetical protein n=1 Tax=Streptomyces sp. PA5.6 TaxID=3035651 RepID=UPI003904AE29
MAVRDPYSRHRLASLVPEARNWTDLIRRLGLGTSGGQRRVLQEKVTGHGIDTSHFAKRSPWRKYPDADIAEAAASSSSLRDVALKLGATPATGMLSHIRRRIDAAGIDISHFPGIDRPELDLPFSTEELQAAAATATSVRGVARTLGVPDDSRSRATLSRMLRARNIDTARRPASASTPATSSAKPGAGRNSPGGRTGLSCTEPWTRSEFRTRARGVAIPANGWGSRSRCRSTT